MSTPTLGPPNEGTQPHPEPLDLRTLGKQIDLILATSATELEATDEFLGLTRQLTHSQAVVYFGTDASGQLATSPCSRGEGALAESTLNQLYVLARRAQSAESAQVVQTRSEPPRVAVAVPVFRRAGGIEVLVALTGWTTDERRNIAATLQVLQLLAAFAGQWRGNFDQLRNATKLDMLSGWLRTASAANGCSSLTEAAEQFAAWLADEFSQRIVAIGVRRRGGTCRLVAISDHLQVTPGAPLVSLIESALAERMVMSEADPIERLTGVERETDAVIQLRKLLDTPAIYRSVLRDGLGEVYGACLVVGDAPLTSDQALDLRHATDFMGPYLARVQRHRLPWLQRGRLAFDRLTAETRRTVLVTAWAAAVVLFALPLPYRVKCRCEVQPVTRRFVAAPYEGRLQETRVELGDLVTAGQVMAVMDGREIRLELAALEAELQRVTKQRDRALANRETAAAQIALLEMQRLQTNMQLYQDRLQNLEIRSPTDGVVISGDLKKLTGARLMIGQTLLEVGPLGEMVLELAIPDEDILHVKSDAPVRFRLDALPQSTLQGRLVRIQPRSELRDNKNVFIGEVRIAQDATVLRPGMRGRAKLAAGHRSLFWILFHRAIERLLFQLGW